MKWKTLTGIILIIGSLLTLVFWETRGRDIVLLSPVLSARVDMKEGTVVAEEDFKEIKVLPDNVLSGALLPQDLDSLSGLVLNRDISENQQLLPSYFQQKHTLLQEKDSIFVVPSGWIYSMSSAVRAKDLVLLYSFPENICLGQYTVAFVKDKNQREVRDISGLQSDFLKRMDADAEISYIEIICTLEEYLAICQVAEGAEFGKLLIVLKG